MSLKGKAWKFGNDIDTDVIIPAKYLNTIDPKELGAHCMEPADHEFSKKIQNGDMIVAGKNFGCGSSREHAPISIKGAGISCVIAESFARIFFRNSINTGLPIFESKEAARDIQPQDIIEVEAETGAIRNLTKNKIYKSEPLPDFVREIIKSGGLLNWINKK